MNRRERDAPIGLLLVRNEQDMLEEALQNHLQFCESIVVLDGSSGVSQRQTAAICSKNRAVVGYWQDADTGYSLPIRDGGRQFLLARARVLFGTGRWYAVLHGDELWASDPRPTLAEIGQVPVGLLANLYHFFPHVSEKPSWSTKIERGIEHCSEWYMEPPIAEHRLFFDAGEHDYEVDQHSRTIPGGLEERSTNLVIKQYNYRTPEQAHKRALDRRLTGWQRNHYQHLIDGTSRFFVEQLGDTGERWADSVPIGEGRPVHETDRPLPSLPPHGSSSFRGDWS